MAEPAASDGTANGAGNDPTLLTNSLRLSGRMAKLAAASFALNYGLFACIAHGLHWRSEWAALIAMALVMVMNFIACRRYVFEAERGNWWTQALRFAGGTVVFRAAELAAFSLVIGLTLWDSLVVYPSILLLFFLIKMLVYSRFVFNGPQQRV
jgi:putative flippase GtrA